MKSEVYQKWKEDPVTQILFKELETIKAIKLECILSTTINPDTIGSIAKMMGELNVIDSLLNDDILTMTSLSDDKDVEEESNFDLRLA